jgi:hypothetical protein
MNLAQFIEDLMVAIFGSKLGCMIIIILYMIFLASFLGVYIGKLVLDGGGFKFKFKFKFTDSIKSMI